ncbi:MarR family winged helix-turn-helix transcriptional regulator [Streptococcus macacae]|uniref:Sugar-specific transcriptional regulator, TrmB family n=1 Tax=Streptococcus macacae NCTC 11558 TaxID=764298 RepID=G5JUL0_9STRE|nr:MarR family transcriptional regulator [Streptococcus macacae]EHJ52609.1 sugar-specific transcriptional regulator, TrmB family [Streptococcus macacae NCTC 11558]SUN78651.1 transcriptional regulator [Streptococcus macacae NCTC 11558]
MNYQKIILEMNTFFQKYKELEYKQHTIKDLNFAEVQTIVLLAKNSQLTLADISRERNISRSAVTQVIKKLERKHYINRVKVDDKRFNFELTEQGQAVCQEHYQQHSYLNEHLEVLLKQYPEEFFQMLSQLMSEVEYFWDHLPWNGEKE